jgi:UDP-N-acetylglucosamine/UDP-N-acetylgalactosamine diphosphorylase
MMQKPDPVLDQLLRKGVCIPVPQAVEIGPEVNPDRISGKDVTIHAGCRIFGRETCIGDGAQIGSEAPATIENCQVGPGASLKGGFFSHAVFLKGASCGSCAHVRNGSILEEKASIAHTVGLKQTILFPFVTLGSLINFCDCLMAGGTDSKNHSEVGSSYIHFNYTPQQDKATASLIGDVPQGVMLDQPPIFLGGQGGLVGPCRLAYGTTIAAGTICRKDELRRSRLIFGGSAKAGNISYIPGAYSNAKRTLSNNLFYIGNLLALGQWYQHVRSRFISQAHPAPLHEGLTTRLEEAVSERIKRLSGFLDNLENPGRAEEANGSGDGGGRPLVRHSRDLLLAERKSAILEVLHRCREPGRIRGQERVPFLRSLDAAIAEHGKSYLDVIKSLSKADKARGTRWLQSIVDEVVGGVLELAPEFHMEKGS